MQYIKDKDIEGQLNFICGFINRSQYKAVVTTESLARDMIRHGISEFFRGNVKLIEGERDAPKE